MQGEHGQGGLIRTVLRYSTLRRSMRRLQASLGELRLPHVAMRDCDSHLISQKYKVHGSSDHQNGGG